MGKEKLTPDAQWISDLTDEVYYGPTEHPARRHAITAGLLMAFRGGVLAANGQSPPEPKLGKHVVVTKPKEKKE